MQTALHTPISHKMLEEKLKMDQLNNHDERKGTAVVNVLSPEAFNKDHIPGSINIPQNDIEQFDKRFKKDKEIVVYCASKECDASTKVAEQLAAKGFTQVRDYEPGMKGWNDAKKNEGS